MEIYLYSAHTGEFTGQAVADANPLEVGKFLIPANATESQPPTPGLNEVAVFEGGTWVLKPDFRGQDFYSKTTGAKVRISDIGALSDDLTTLTPFVNASWDSASGSWKVDTSKALAAIRAQRNSLLSTSDWTQLPDCQQSTAEKAAWAAYRQALRDFPASCDPSSPQWPVQPK